MYLIRSMLNPISRVLVFAMLSLSLHIPAASAAMVGTDQALAAQQADEARSHALTVLHRADVSAKLQSYGVSPADAEQRIAALSDQEAVQLAQQLDQAPAGGDLLGTVVFVFLVLLFTDILGFTNVFPFVKKTAR
ncbi:MAG: PA2779 family protein [Pseudomonadota bacterium]